MAERRVVIVGGGVVGLFCAWYARRAGFAVTLVERGDPEHDCCSLGNAGQIVPSHFQPLAAPGMTAMALRSLFTPESPVRMDPRFDLRFFRWGLDFIRSASAAHVERCSPVLRDYGLLSRQCYLDLAAPGREEIKLAQRGLLMLSRTEVGFGHERDAAAAANRLGMDARVLSAAECRALEPAMRLDVLGGVYFPLDAHLAPQRLVAMLTRELLADGVQIMWNTNALGWRANGARVEALLTSAGELVGDEYVLAAGAWSPNVVAGLKLRLPVEAGKGYSLTLTQPPVLPAVSAVLTEARVAMTPMGDHLRFAGTMQFAGLDLTIDSRRVKPMIEAISKYLPDLNASHFSGVTPWTGLRPCTPDGMPFLGRSRRYTNFIVATGHAMMGVSLAPGTGHIVGELLQGRPGSVALELMRPDRFG